MSVVVRMEMPSCCHDCPFEADQWDYPICRVTGRSEGYRFDARNNRMVDCPIICQLPAGHGRLGDLDELGRKINGARIRVMQDGQDTNPYWECGDIIASEQTIVPAERSETE
jgi:hypothetical protein